MARGNANLICGGQRCGFVILLRPLLVMVVTMGVSGCPAGGSGGDKASNSRTSQSEQAPERSQTVRKHPAFHQMLEPRAEMVRWQIEARRISDPNVLEAMRTVPRHAFVPAEYQPDAYADHPLPIGHGQTISQPYIVAFMTELARPVPADRALEIGTGSGYQAAVLSRVVSHVYSLELDGDLARQASERLAALGYGNV